LEDEGKVAAMEGYFFTFGRGPRTCIGKSVSLMEMWKVIPALVVGWEWEVFEGEGGRNGGWTFCNDWFVRQEGFMVRVAERRG